MRIALALGSGGARGYAHIGVVDELRDRGHDVVAISGTSMGSVVGGLEAAGRLDQFTEWVTSLTQRDIWRLLDPAFTGPGAIRGERVMDRIADILGGVRIEELPIPFTAVATDLRHRREVWFQRGTLATAIRASIGIPSVFTPVVVADRLLADGGLLNPVPVDALLGTPADLTVAVSLSGRRANESSGRPFTDSADPADEGGVLSELTGRVRQGLLESETARSVRLWWAERFPDTGSSPGRRVEKLPGNGDPTTDPDKPPVEGSAPVEEPAPDFDVSRPPRGLRTSEVVALSLETAEALITRFRMAASPPDVFIEFPQDIASTFDFHRASELIERGRAQAAAALDAVGA